MASALQAVRDEMVESIVTDNIPILTEQEKFNETAVSSVKRIAAKLRGQEDPGPPVRADTTRSRTFKTKVGALIMIQASSCDVTFSTLVSGVHHI